MLIDLIIIIFGCAIGSFLTVCIYRIPFTSLPEEEDSDVVSEEKPAEPPTGFEQLPTSLKSPIENLSINNPKRSFCPNCLQKLRWWHNIPVLSWLFLGGKCNYCKKPISARYPLIELSTGLLAILCYRMYGINYTGVTLFIVCCALLVIMIIDYDYYIIPNVISIPGTILAFIIAITSHVTHIFEYPIVQTIQDSIFGVLAGAGTLFLVSEFYIRVRKMEGLGMGDVKLLAMIGALFGIQCSLYTIVVGSLFGAVFGIGLILVQGRKMSQPLPFGPYLCSATLIYIFGGPKITEKTIGAIVNLFNFAN